MPAQQQLPIAVLLDTLDDEYQVALMRGALSAARDLGLTLLCVPGGRVGDVAGERAARNIAFELANAGTVSGVVAVSSVIGTAIGAEALARWLERYRGLPLCSVGVPVPGAVAVEVDNSNGIRELVLHLARAHDRSRIAFLRGPSTSVEANARFGAYRAALEELGRPFEPALVVDGDFLKPSGTNAVRTLFDERSLKGKLDAIAVANDYMALGVMEELWRRHVDIPGEVAVVGFDDVDSARLAGPALTTACQPIELVGRSAVEAAFELVQGRGAPSISLKTKLVMRSSCGCAATEVGLAGSLPLTASRGVDVSFVQRRHAILAELSRAGQGRLGAAGSGWEARLLDALIGDLRQATSSSFYRTFERLLQKLGRAAVDGIILQDVLTALRRQSLPCVASDPVARDRLENTLHDTRVLTGAFSEEASEQRARRGRERQRAFEHGLRSALFSDTLERSAISAERLPDFGVEACVVAALKRPGEVTGGADLVFGFGPRERLKEALPVELGDLPRHALFENVGRILVALPLTSADGALGAAVIALSKPPDDELEQLREFLSTTLDTLRHAKAPAR